MQVELLFASLLNGDVSVIPEIETALAEGVSDAGKAVYACVEHRGYKRGSHVEPAKRIPGRYVVITPGKSIRVVGLMYPNGTYGEAGNPCGKYDRTFTIGETAEYDSYNFSYHGTIQSIGAGGNVTITKDHGSKRSARLDADTFTWRNWDLDLEAAAERKFDVLAHC